MKNLENFGVEETTQQEMTEINGGILPLGIMVAIWGIQMATCVGLIGVYASTMRR